MNRFFLISLLIILCLTPHTAQAQTETPTPAPTEEGLLIPQIHTVQDGENLTIIAEQYGVTVEEILLVNNLSPDAILQVGQQLTIPGKQGDVVAAVYRVQAGDTIRSIAAAFNTSETAVLQSNRLIYPAYDLAVGQTLFIVSRTGTAEPQAATGTPHIVARDETLLSIAAHYGLSPFELVSANQLPYPTYLYPGQRLRIPSPQPYRPLAGEWTEVEIRPLPILQGSTVSIYVQNLLPGIPTGQLAGHTLHFTPYQDGYIALAGLDSFTPAGLHTLQLSGSGDRPWRPFQQNVQVQSGNYGIQNITVSEELAPLLAPEVRREEDAFLATIFTQFNDTQLWDGLFQLPVTNTVVTAGYGDGRSYNGGPVEIFHTGVDFAGTIGTPILAPAVGTVVYNDFLQLRGNVLILDHGLGVMTAYYHLSETFVAVGDTVQPGQMIAAGGSTGLSTGAHLHWDVRISDVAVNPLQWTTEMFP